MGPKSFFPRSRTAAITAVVVLLVARRGASFCITAFKGDGKSSLPLGGLIGALEVWRFGERRLLLAQRLCPSVTSVWKILWLTLSSSTKAVRSTSCSALLSRHLRHLPEHARLRL
mmetsp:Transcript_13479/g.50186  ORF Transcript_13479/g.50186 Transcript_13479/m.50186 type:complete len:115 (+) Transcript_13479:337-681(+)